MQLLFLKNKRIIRNEALIIIFIVEIVFIINFNTSYLSYPLKGIIQKKGDKTYTETYNLFISS